MIRVIMWKCKWVTNKRKLFSENNSQVRKVWWKCYYYNSFKHSIGYLYCDANRATGMNNKSTSSIIRSLTSGLLFRKVNKVCIKAQI